MNDAVLLPPCRCGVRAWTPGGGSLSPGFCQRNYTCPNCDRHAVELHHAGGTVFVVPVGKDLSDSETAYLNGPLMAAWRDRAERLEAARKRLDDEFRLELNRALGLPPEARGPDVPDGAFPA